MNKDIFGEGFPVTNSKNVLYIAYVIEKFPSPTEYFILNEMLALEKRGIPIVVCSIKPSNHTIKIKEFDGLKAPVLYSNHAFYVLFFNFIRCFKQLSTILKGHKKLNIKTVLKQLKYLLLAIDFEKQLKDLKIRHVHAHFAFITTDVGYILSKLLKVNFSFTAHAQDIYLNQKNIIRKIENSDFVITCTRYNCDYLNNLTGNTFDQKIYPVYHGIDTKEIVLQEKERLSNGMTRILTVARLVEKKGIIYLIKALKILIDDKLNIKCTVIGDGSLWNELNHYAITEKISNNVEFLGLKARKEVMEEMHRADIFVLPSITDTKGDRDGLPNVLLEAMTMRLPVITTRVSGIPELIEDDYNGILVPEKDEKALAKAILRLINDNILYNSIVNHALDKIRNHFDIDDCTKQLLSIFEQYAKN